MEDIIALADTSFAKMPARQVSRSGSFDLPCSAEAAFPLFSPQREREWVKGWDPQPVFPATLEFCRDTVFRQGQGAEEAVWTILDADWKAHRAEYVRVAPASHSARIVVKVDSLGANKSHVVVSYTVTAFGEQAALLIEGFSEEAYSARMRDWQHQISDYLTKAERNESVPPHVGC